jgi:hypothetical protein
MVFNIALGRVAELYNRIDTNDPAASTMIIAILATSGLEIDSTLQDKVTMTDLVSGATDEVTNSGYARKVLTDSDILAFAPDNTNNRVDLDIPDQTWTSVAAGSGWSKLVTFYDPSSSGVTATVMIPMTLHDFVVVPDGSNITAQIAAAGFFRAVSS